MGSNSRMYMDAESGVSGDASTMENGKSPKFNLDAGSGLGGGLGAVIGGLFGKHYIDEAQPAADALYGKSADVIAQELAAIQGIRVPTQEEQKIALQRLASVGEVTPEMIQLVTQDPSLMANVSTDPRLAKAQMQALESLSKQGEVGLTATDRAALNQVRNQVAREAQGREGAILQNMAARGMGGSGAELIARLSGSQAATEEASNQSDRLAAMAQQNALEARAKAGILGGSMRGQEFEEKSAKAKAQDVINQFNAANRQNVGAMNTQVRNAAQAAKLANDQRIADTNVGLANQEQTYNKQLPQQAFSNALSLTNAGNSVLDKQSGVYKSEADRTMGKAYQDANMVASLGQGIGQFVGGAGQLATMAMVSDKSAKKDIHPGDEKIQKLLDKLDAYSFNYKEPMKHGEGERLGVMAQDLEKSNAGKQVVEQDNEGTKEINAEKAISILLAAAGNMNKRLKKLGG